MRKLVLFIFLLAAWQIYAQQKIKLNAPFTIKGNIGIPKTISSKLFRTCFKGVVESNLTCNFRLFNNFYGGLGYQNSYFQNDKNVFVKYKASNGGISYDTRLICNAGMLRLSYDYYFSEIGYISAAVNAGYAFANYQKTINDSSGVNLPFVGTKFSAPFIQPEFSVNFVSEKMLSFSILLAYNTLFYHFDPKAPRFKQFPEVNEQLNRNKYVMSWLNIGFGFTILIN